MERPYRGEMFQINSFTILRRNLRIGRLWVNGLWVNDNGLYWVHRWRSIPDAILRIDINFRFWASGRRDSLNIKVRRRIVRAGDDRRVNQGRVTNGAVDHCGIDQHGVVHATPILPMSKLTIVSR